MASYIRKKEALRGATYAFLAGAHRVTEEVERLQSVVYESGGTDETREDRRTMLIENYSRVTSSPDVAEYFAAILNDEELYPFGSMWNVDVIREVFSKTIAPDPDFSEDGFEESVETELYTDSDGDEFWVEKKTTAGSSRFRFRQGYKKILTQAAEQLDGDKKKPDSVDHWLVQLLNISFHAGMNIAAQCAENAQPYYEAMGEIENDEEPWGRYPQIVAIFERQLRRETKRKTGLVTTFDE